MRTDLALASVPELIVVLMADQNIHGEQVSETSTLPKLAGSIEMVLKLAAQGFDSSAPLIPDWKDVGFYPIDVH